MVLMSTHADCRDQACELVVAGWSFYALPLPQGLFAQGFVLMTLTQRLTVHRVWKYILTYVLHSSYCTQ